MTSSPRRVRYMSIKSGSAGGAEGTRTPDPHTASVVRYQLRHGPAYPPKGGHPRNITHDPGREPHRHSHPRSTARPGVAAAITRRGDLIRTDLELVPSGTHDAPVAADNGTGLRCAQGAAIHRMLWRRSSGVVCLRAWVSNTADVRHGVRPVDVPRVPPLATWLLSGLYGQRLRERFRPAVRRALDDLVRAGEISRIDDLLDLAVEARVVRDLPHGGAAG